MRRFPLLALLALTASCGWVSFGRRVSDDELRLRSEVKAYYDEVARAFAAGNAEALAGLFDPANAKPMTRPQIKAWAVKFFREHGRATFKVEKLEFDRLGFESGVVTLTYRVDTLDGAGSFGGTEIDELAKRGRRWVVTGWEALKPDAPRKKR